MGHNDELNLPNAFALYAFPETCRVQCVKTLGDGYKTVVTEGSVTSCANNDSDADLNAFSRADTLDPLDSQR